jgi:hypothetical protein
LRLGELLSLYAPNSALSHPLFSSVEARRAQVVDRATQSQEHTGERSDQL